MYIPTDMHSTLLNRIRGPEYLAYNLENILLDTSLVKYNNLFLDLIIFIIFIIISINNNK